MANKYYAVKRGRKTGIFRTWDECKAQVMGFSNPSYKGFQTQEEAKAFLEEDTLKSKSNVKEVLTENCIEAYVDGSYISDKKKEFSYGMVILRKGVEEYKAKEKIEDSELAAMHNVAGEIKGAEAAMRYALQHGADKLIIYHDYEGIAKWCTGEWKANKKGTQAYKQYFDSIKDKMQIKFVKVTGHSNNKYNDLADKLAKQALCEED